MMTPEIRSAVERLVEVGKAFERTCKRNDQILPCVRNEDLLALAPLLEPAKKTMLDAMGAVDPFKMEGA